MAFDDGSNKKELEGTLRVGINNVIKMNRLVRYTMTTTGGTIISGVIPANGQIDVNNGGDIASFDIFVDEIDKELKSVD